MNEMSRNTYFSDSEDEFDDEIRASGSRKKRQIVESDEDTDNLGDDVNYADDCSDVESNEGDNQGEDESGMIVISLYKEMQEILRVVTLCFVIVIYVIY